MTSGYIWSFVGQLADALSSFRPGAAVSAAGAVAAALAAASADPCVAIANRTWVAPADVRACYDSFAVNATEKYVNAHSEYEVKANLYA
jgi:hypothetical protein